MPLESAQGNKTRVASDTKVSLLKILREKKNMSRADLSRLVPLSTYQIEGLEDGNGQGFFHKFLNCTRALGYRTSDVLLMLAKVCESEDFDLLKGVLGKPSHSVRFENGARIHKYISQSENFFGLLELEKNHAIEMAQIHPGDVILGIVREGTLVVDSAGNISVHKKDSFFILPGRIPATFLNEDSYVRTADVLIFSVKYPAGQTIL